MTPSCHIPPEPIIHIQYFIQTREIVFIRRLNLEKIQIVDKDDDDCDSI
jgi:hypothetical protein